jgi:hypothetical protein
MQLQTVVERSVRQSRHWLVYRPSLLTPSPRPAPSSAFVRTHLGRGTFCRSFTLTMVMECVKNEGRMSWSHRKNSCSTIDSIRHHVMFSRIQQYKRTWNHGAWILPLLIFRESNKVIGLAVQVVQKSPASLISKFWGTRNGLRLLTLEREMSIAVDLAVIPFTNVRRT